MSCEKEIVMYGNLRCRSVRRVRLFLDLYKIPYYFINIGQDKVAASRLESLTGGYRSVPTLEWPDGSILVEPSEKELANKFKAKM